MKVNYVKRNQYDNLRITQTLFRRDWKPHFLVNFHKLISYILKLWSADGIELQFLLLTAVVATHALPYMDCKARG